MLRRLLTDHREVPWQAMWYLTGEIAYGGRVTDSWDQRCLQSILHKYYNPDVLEEDYGYTSDLVSKTKPCLKSAFCLVAATRIFHPTP